MVALPKDAQKQIAREFRFAADRMAEAPDLATKTYFFSAFYGELARIQNYLWIEDLSLAHLVLQAAHTAIKGRIDAAILGTESGLGFPPEFADRYTKLAIDLAALFEKPEVEDAALYMLLARVSTLAHVTTGNGYYLYLKGLLKLDEPIAPVPPSARSRAGARGKASRP